MQSAERKILIAFAAVFHGTDLNCSLKSGPPGSATNDVATTAKNRELLAFALAVKERRDLRGLVGG